MLRFLLRRVLLGIPVLVAVATLTFLIMHWVPGGPFDSEKILPPAIIANIEAKYHLDQPVGVQHLLYMKQLLQGDLGPSYKYIGRDVSDILRDTFPVSFTLGMCAVLVVLGMGVPAGIISAYWKNSLLDRSILLFAAMGISIPSFVLGAVSVWIFSHQWHLLPPALWEGPRYMILPAFALGAGFAGYIARLTRTTVLDVLSSDYIRTARAKGLTEFKILIKHVLINSIYPIVSVMGPLTAGLVTGSFVIEFVFFIPGMGRFFISAVTNRDYPLILGVNLVFAVFIVVANIVVDIIYGWLDPRVSVKLGYEYIL